MIDSGNQTTLYTVRAAVERCANALADQGFTIAFAESATAGFVAYLFSLTEKSGNVLKGGVVCYDAGVKETLLGVSPARINRFTAESAEVSAAIAEGLSSLVPATLHVGITGLTKPGGSESPLKPVGTIFTVIRSPRKTISDCHVFSGTETEIIAAAASNMCSLIEQHITSVK